MLALYLLVLICTAAVHAHPDGAPLDACDTMTPLHSGTLPQPAGTLPFVITASSYSAAPGEQITVSISAPGGETFQGFLLKALFRGVDSGAQGTFVNNLSYAQYLACSNVTQGAVTHTEPSNKTAVTVNWFSNTPGVFNFKATVAEYYDTYWVGFYSGYVTVQ